MSNLVKDNKIENKNESSFSAQLNSKLSAKTSETDEKKRKNSRFYYSVGDFKLLLEQDIKAENLSKPKIYKLPHAPNWCLGMVNVRGIILPVVDMHYVLETGQKTPKTGKLLWLQHNNLKPIILQIDDLPTMINYDDYKTANAPEGSQNWLTSTLNTGSKEIYVVDHEQLLTQLKNSQ